MGTETTASYYSSRSVSETPSRIQSLVEPQRVASCW